MYSFLIKDGLYYFPSNTVIGCLFIAILNIQQTDRLLLKLKRANTVKPVECVLRLELISFDEVTVLDIYRKHTETTNSNISQL